LDIADSRVEQKSYKSRRVKTYYKLCILITPSPERDRGNGPETRPGIELSRRGDVIPNLSALGEEVRQNRGPQQGPRLSMALGEG